MRMIHCPLPDNRPPTGPSPSRRQVKRRDLSTMNSAVPNDVLQKLLDPRCTYETATGLAHIGFTAPGFQNNSVYQGCVVHASPHILEQLNRREATATEEVTTSRCSTTLWCIDDIVTGTVINDKEAAFVRPDGHILPMHGVDGGLLLEARAKCA